MKIKFHNRATFDLATKIIVNEPDIYNNLDIGYSDMLISFFNGAAKDNCILLLSAFQIWDKPSFKGGPDFEYCED